MHPLWPRNTHNPSGPNRLVLPQQVIRILTLDASKWIKNVVIVSQFSLRSNPKCLFSDQRSALNGSCSPFNLFFLNLRMELSYLKGNNCMDKPHGCRTVCRCMCISAYGCARDRWNNSLLLNEGVAHLSPHSTSQGLLEPQQT